MLKDNKYYVYGHYTVKDNLLFYIGKGSGGRSTKTGRSKVWNEFVKNNEWYAKILHENLSSSEALRIEKELILSSDVINTAVNNTTKQITAETLQWFRYDESSPTCLVWNKDVVGTTGRIYKKQGEIAGRLHPTSDLKNHRYVVVMQGSQMYVHRLVYALFNKISEDKVIDHIDGNSLNNKIANLREVSQMINAKNTSRTCKSNTGVTGVTCVTRKRLGFKQYIASWYNSEDKLTIKEFSSYKLGEAEAFRLACEWRKEQIRLLNEQGAGYTERHGT